MQSSLKFQVSTFKLTAPYFVLSALYFDLARSKRCRDRASSARKSSKTKDKGRFSIARLQILLRGPMGNSGGENAILLRKLRNLKTPVFNGNEPLPLTAGIS